MSKMTSEKLHRARLEKNDEFYTRMIDIETECDNYAQHFKDKVIYCNCDTDDSNFVKYFTELKRMGKIRDVIWSGGLDGLDFRGRQSIELLKQADIVVTNPPFSLFRQYIAQLIDYNKKFLIIGNFNSVMYKDFFPLIKQNKVWLGATSTANPMFFDVPDIKRLINNGKPGGKYNIIKGEIKARVLATWFTNIPHNVERSLNLIKTYYGNEQDYPKYDNADAININRKTEIPSDYYGTMGVPITFLDRYDPNRFLILGLDKDLTNDKKGCRIAGKSIYTRIFIQNQGSVIANDNKALTGKAA